MLALKESQVQQGKSVIFSENSISAIPIVLQQHEAGLFDCPTDLDEMYTTTKNKLAAISHLAIQAFEHKAKPAWDNIQNLLYIWNIQELFRINLTGQSNFYNNHVCGLLRNKVLEIENNAEPSCTLECKNNFTPEKATQELYDRARSHRINYHPLLEELSQNGLSSQEVKIFLENYYVNNRVFHVLVSAVSHPTPMEMRVELYKNLFDELGAGDAAMAHPILFLKNFDTIGKPNKISPLAESLHLFNAKFAATYLSGNYHLGTGGLGFIELTMPEQMIKILDGLRKSKIPERDLEFWNVHISIDIEHGRAWFHEMQELIKTPADAESCLRGGLRLIEARATLYDGIWNCIRAQRDISP